MSNPISYQILISGSFDETLTKVIEALKKEGFGILSQIDVQQTFKEKLDTDFRPFIILGACNPPLAYQALQNDPRVGLLLPCNVTIEQLNNEIVVQIINPEAMLGLEPLAENEKIKEVASEAKSRLERVAAALSN